jgi:hypothetical protein
MKCKIQRRVSFFCRSYSVSWGLGNFFSLNFRNFYKKIGNINTVLSTNLVGKSDLAEKYWYICVADPGSRIRCFLTPGSGMGKNPERDRGTGINIPYLWYLLSISFLGYKPLNFFMRIRIWDRGCAMEKIISGMHKCFPSSSNGYISTVIYVPLRHSPKNKSGHKLVFPKFSICHVCRIRQPSCLSSHL